MKVSLNTFVFVILICVQLLSSAFYLRLLISFLAFGSLIIFMRIIESYFLLLNSYCHLYNRVYHLWFTFCHILGLTFKFIINWNNAGIKYNYKITFWYIFSCFFLHLFSQPSSHLIERTGPGSVVVHPSRNPSQPIPGRTIITYAVYSQTLMPIKCLCLLYLYNIFSFNWSYTGSNGSSLAVCQQIYFRLS